MVKLFHGTKTRSHLVRFTLEELGVPYELERVDLSKGEHKSPAYTAVHPHGVMPALVDGDQTVIECAAICMYLADKYADKHAGGSVEKRLAPPVSSPARGAYYQWCVYAIATMLPALSKVAMNTIFLPEAMRAPAVAEQGRSEWKAVAPVIARALEGRPYLLGTELTTADVLIGGSLWLANLVGLVDAYPTLAAYYARIAARPAFARAFAD